MTENKFFLRREYTQDEKQDRVKAKEFTIDNEPILNIIDGTKITPGEVDDLGKEEFLSTLRSNLPEDDYEEFIDRMFRKYGREGDRFNQQLFRLPPNADISGLYSSLERFTDGPLSKPFDFILSRPLFLRELEKDNDNIDLRFQTESKIREFESDEDIPIRIVDERGEEIDRLEENQGVRVPTQQRIEARIYTEERILSVSNSEVSEGLQSEIFNIILSIISDSPEINYEEEDNV